MWGQLLMKKDYLVEKIDRQGIRLIEKNYFSV